MPSSQTRLLVGSGLVLATLAATMAADGGSDGDSDGGRPRSDARTVSGIISAVAWPDAKLTVDASDGPVTLQIDRNTAVFLDDRLGSPRDLVVGASVRASFGGDRRAAWIEVRPRGPTSAAARDGGGERSDTVARDAGTGLGPPVLAPRVGAPDAGGADGGSQPPAPADAGATPAPAGDVPAGPSPTEPNPGAPPRPPPPGPAGPGPVPGGPQR